MGQACQMVVQDPCWTSKPVLVLMPEAWLHAGFAIAGHGEPRPNFFNPWALHVILIVGIYWHTKVLEERSHNEGTEGKCVSILDSS